MAAPAVNLVPGSIETLYVGYGNDFERDYLMPFDVTGAEIIAAIVDPTGALVLAFTITVTTPANPCAFSQTLASAAQLGSAAFYPGGEYRHDRRIIFADGTVKSITRMSPLIVVPTATPLP